MHSTCHVLACEAFCRRRLAKATLVILRQALCGVPCIDVGRERPLPGASGRHWKRLFMCTQLKVRAPVGLHSAGYPEVRQQLRGTGCGSCILQCAEPLQHVFQAHLHAAHDASHGGARQRRIGRIKGCELLLNYEQIQENRHSAGLPKSKPVQ